MCLCLGWGYCCPHFLKSVLFLVEFYLFHSGQCRDVGDEAVEDDILVDCDLAEPLRGEE